jgi:hypothetical protein
MTWSHGQHMRGVAHHVRAHFTAIELHTHAVRRRLQRPGPAARAEALDHLDAIEAHTTQAAAQVGTLRPGNC